MYRIKYSFLLLFLLSILYTTAQTNQPKPPINTAFKLSMQPTMAEGSGDFHLRLKLRAALMFKRAHRKSWHELEIGNCGFSKNKQSFSTSSQSISLGLRYEYDMYILDFHKNIQFFIAFGLQPFYSNTLRVSGGSNHLREKNGTFELEYTIAPRVIWNFHKHWLLDFNVPISAFNAYLYHQYYNPTATPQEQKMGIMEEGVLARWSFRIGIGYRF